MTKTAQNKASITFLNRVYPSGRGASGRVLQDLARSFAREGWDVRVVTTGVTAGRSMDGDVEVIRVKGGEKPKGAFGYGWVLFKMYMRALFMRKSDVLVTMSDPPFLVSAGQMLKRLKGGKHIHWCHDLYPDLLPALGVRLPKFLMNASKRRVRKDMARADKLVVIGRCMAKRLVREGFKAGDMTLIPNWPDFELVRPPIAVNSNEAVPVPENARPFDEQHKHGPKFRVLYAGTLGRAHPVRTIIGAAEILAVEHPEIEFVFVGDGARFESLSRERQKRHLDNIRFMPYQPLAKLREIMESGDVHLISVKHQAAGMLVPSKLYSGLAVGRPCVLIGPKSSEAAKVIGDYKAGAVVRQGDARGLAEHIKRYRLSADDWFAAHHGAQEAAQVFVPKEAINAWIERASDVAGLPVQERDAA